MQRKIIFLFVISIPLLFPIGCGGPKKPDGLPALHPVTLQLEQDGKPLAGADVTLNSDSKWSSGGVSDANGVVTVRTHGQFSGVPLGHYKVVVSKTKSSSASTDTDISQAKSIAEIQELEAKANEQHNPKDFGSTTYLIERKYSGVNTTPLEIDVVAGKNNFKLDVGPAVEIAEKHSSPMGR